MVAQLAGLDIVVENAAQLETGAQLRQSACYQRSERMTCLTCHDPHAREKPKDPAAFYRQKCLSCHGVAACGLDQACYVLYQLR